MKLNTVNVVEYVGGTLSSIRSFQDDEEGSKEAEALFTKIAEENGFDADVIELGLDEGSCSMVESDYQLFIIHSQN